MQISRQQLTQAVAQGIVSEEQAQRLVQFISEELDAKALPDKSVTFDFTHVLYYLGDCWLLVL
ncbi:hypothetical protein FX988_00694 [Paraglaciecola mesophila]|uniref:Uncharacterized protein n=1 Tax=Paraglaciecola mesophila TaxID=197222 RepID=A0A857JH24_9ALTE|nr:hypothetical protein FX988_00694 [Paraglaciecola mesophila]